MPYFWWRKEQSHKNHKKPKKNVFVICVMILYRSAQTERETYRNCITQPRISFIVCQCPIYLLQIKGRENLSLSVNFGNIHQLTGPWTSLLWVGPLLGTQKHTTCNWVKKCKKWPASILDVPAPIVRARPRYQPPLAPLSEAREGTKDYKRSCKERINQIFPHHHTVFLMKM